MLLELKNDLKAESVQDIYLKYLVGNNVWYFEKVLKLSNPSKTYDNFKKMIAKGLDIEAQDVAIMGSAKTGLSFNPGKKFKYFNERSDIDLVLVSKKYYKNLWKAYLDMFYKSYNVPEAKDVHKSIFKGFICMKEPTMRHKTIENWIRTVGPLVKDLQLEYKMDRQINYRVYEDWASVKKYHLFGISQLKNHINNNQKHDQAIGRIINSLINKKYENNK